MKEPKTSFWNRFIGVLAALVLGDRRNTICREFSIRQTLSSAYYRHCRWPLTYALWRELRSFPFRILATHETLGDHVGPDLGTRFQNGEGEILNVGDRCRSLDTQGLRFLFPWVTPLDLELFLLGRAAGELCQAGNRCNGRHVEMASMTSANVYRATRLASLQSTICDPSAPLPSSESPLRSDELGTHCTRT